MNEEKMLSKKEPERGSGFIGDLLATGVKYFKWIVLAIVLVILVSGVRTVKQGEVAIVLRFGKLCGETREEQVHEPGLLLAFPYIIDEVITVPTGKVFDLTVDTHYTEGEMTSDVSQNGYCITGDHNIAVISTSLKYVISDPVAYALYTADMNATVKGVVSGAITSHVASVEIDPLLTTGKDEFVREVMEQAQLKLDALGCGIRITALDVSTIAPPSEVKGAFERVNSAKISVQTKLAEAAQYEATLIPSARTDANNLESQALVEKNEAVGNAQTLLSEFWGLLEEFENEDQQDIVILRVFNEKMAEIYEKAGNVIIVDEKTPNIVLPTGE